MQFRLACSKIPKDVLLLEIGPHALMRSPLRQNRSDLQVQCHISAFQKLVAVWTLWPSIMHAKDQAADPCMTSDTQMLMLSPRVIASLASSCSVDT